MMRLLAIDTSGDACSVALRMNGECRWRHRLDPRGHARSVLPMVEELLAESGLRLNQLDGFAFGRGPGSFTGLRIGCAVVQGLAFAADRPVVPVSSLAALAQAAPAERVLACFDARMGEVYWGAYRRGTAGLVTLVGEEGVAPPARVACPPDGEWEGIGVGWSAYREGLPQGIRIHAEPRWPHAREVALLGARGLAAGQAVSAAEAIPVYLRDRVAHPPASSGAGP
jgi:tRNA threonylcarbamoyladenosine biosynthesis protein TsaB